MLDFINQNFEKDRQIGQIRFISNSKYEDSTVDSESKSMFKLIADISNLHLVESNSKTVYINDFKPGSKTLDIIENIVNDTDNIILKGYFYDVLQVNKRNKFINAKNAISSYSKILDRQNTISKKREYYIRILNILHSLGKGNIQLIPLTVPKILDELINADIEIDSYTITKIAEEIIPLNANFIDWSQYTLKIKKGIKFFKDSCKFEQYRQCNHILALLLKEDQLEYGQNVARSYFWEAIEYDKTPNISQHLIVSLYKKGLKIFENLQITTSEVNERKLQLIEVQKKAANQLSDFRIKETLSVEKQNIQIPDNINTVQAVYWLISSSLLPKILSESILTKEKESLYFKYFSSSITDIFGYTIDTSSDNEKNLFMIAKQLRDNYCYSLIIPAYEEFLENFAISELEILELISSSKFIPRDRLDLYAHALYQGFCGNFAAAVYILIPQIENGLRYILESNNIIVRKLTKESQNTMGLDNYFEKLETLLNKDLLFDLRVLLIEGFGDNMRHDIAHGLYPTSKIFSNPGIYLWWLSLKLAIDFDSFSSQPLIKAN